MMMENVVKLIKNGDKGILQISEFCYDSTPCQHFCIYKTQDGKQIELCFLWKNEIVKLLNMGVNAENVLISVPKHSDFKDKSLHAIKAHFQIE